MGFLDYLSDLYSSLAVQDTLAEEPGQLGGDARQFEGPLDTSGEQNKGKDASSGGIGSAQQDRGATTKGGVSLDTPASGTDEESGEEAEVNQQDAAKQAEKKSSQPAEKGHTPGDGGEGSGQKGAGASGPHGGPVVASKGGDEGEEEEGGEEDEEEEDEDEPVDPKPRLEEECMRSQQCAPLKHHYDECTERVQQQQEQDGKAHEDCVEEFFHLMHCASTCAAPKLFNQLK